MEVLYVHTEERHNTRAALKVLPLIFDIHKPTSIIDIGCGTGTWLNVAKDVYGIDDILGIDGDFVNMEKLIIPREKFVPADLRKGYKTDRSYDMAICLEVAEHLPESSAGLLVESLTSASDFILFSAALPSQGGENHLNERPFEYWQALFREKGYEFYDLLRPRIWNDGDIEWWYRQNMFVVVNGAKYHFEKTPIFSAHHPQHAADFKRHFINVRNRIKNGELGVSESFKIFRKSLVHWYSRKFS